jgi:tetratricopeptide (TPR) repeat protein
MSKPAQIDKQRRDAMDAADALLDRLPVPEPLSPGQVARIRAQIDARTARAWWTGRRLALVGFLGVLLSASAAAAIYEFLGAQRPATTTGYPVEPNRASPAETSAVVPPAPDSSFVEPAPPANPSVPPPSRPDAPARSDEARPPSAAVPPRSRPRAPARPDEARPPSAPERQEGSLAAEAKLLASALRALRQQHNAKQALAILDEYDVQFPAGTLASEARAARAEALLRTGRKTEALELLDRQKLSPELQVARGELRLAAGRVREALADFDAALAGTQDEIEERALYGRAACRVRLGDPAGGRADLREYLRRFPEGRFAGAAKATLTQSR